MGRLTSLLLLLPLLGGGCKPRAPEAAVRLEVSYNFKAGCITVLARDPEVAGREELKRVEEPKPEKAVLAIFRQESWSYTLELTTMAHEKSCDGPVVAEAKHTVTLQQKGEIEPVALTLEAPDEDGDGYIPANHNGTDCNDNHFDVGDPSFRWYLDQDGDGFGDPNTTPKRSCTKPADSGTTHYVQDATDCKDSDRAVYPRSDVTEARCDEVDDDCDGKVDEGFEAKGTACSDPCPGGQYACNASHTGLSCNNAPTPTLFYPDVDGDGAGDEKGTPAQVCPGATPPMGFVANMNDCDDQDRHNLRGKAEVCDDRDNNCDARQDEDGICGGKGWNVVNDPAFNGNRQWKTVALGTAGRVWIAGDGGKIAVRLAAGEAFKSLDGSCGNVNWRAAWVSPRNNHVFLAGDGGKLAEHDGTTCYNQVTTKDGKDLQGLIGIDILIFVVDKAGRLHVWSPGTNPEERYNLTPQTYFDIHGLDDKKLLTVGGAPEDNLSTPYISSYPGTGNSATAHTVSDVPAGYNGSLRGVWMASSNLAYAVGDGGLVVKWDGATNWIRLNLPPDSSTAPFTSVVAPDPYTIYVTDSNPTGAIRRLSARGTWTTAYPSDRPLRDLAISSSGDIWAVGDDGRVVHFPE